MGKVFKGKKMAGQMGNRLRSVRRLRVMRIDNALNLIYLRGCLPGADNALVRIVDSRDSITNRILFREMPPPYPTFVPSPREDGSAIRLPRLLIAPAVAKTDPQLLL